MTPRQDAGRGTLLEGTGQGIFKSVPGHVSGLRVHGEQRGAASSDFNQDGRVDLLVAQNEDSTKLYVNQVEEQELRVDLQGPKKTSTQSAQVSDSSTQTEVKDRNERYKLGLAIGLKVVWCRPWACRVYPRRYRSRGSTGRLKKCPLPGPRTEYAKLRWCIPADKTT